MATQDALRNRLRCLIDDNGHGYSQSAPGFVTALDTIADPCIDIQIDQDLSPQTVSLGNPADLTTGFAIARAIQDAVRAAAPLPDDSGYTNFSCRYHREEGYVLMSGRKGSESRVSVLTATTGDDVSALLKLGRHNGGLETPPAAKFSDEDLNAMLDEALAYQNAAEDAAYSYTSLPQSMEIVIAYRGWGSVIDCLLGRAANYFPQKVASEETSANVVFDNLFKLRKWLDDRLEDMVDELEEGVKVIEAIRFDRIYGVYVGPKAYKGHDNTVRINAILPGTEEGEVILEFEEVFSQDAKTIFIAYNEASPVWDQTILTEEGFVDPGRDDPACAAENTVVTHTLDTAHYPLVKITGLQTTITYYFGMQMIDQNGNRLFSEEVEYTVPELGG
jgi:hypothetical protein